MPHTLATLRWTNVLVFTTQAEYLVKQTTNQHYMYRDSSNLHLSLNTRNLQANCLQK